MKRTLILMLLTAFFTGAATAQSTKIYLPREYKKALEKGTRSETGAPGPAYFQNRADYSISASFDPQTRILKGSETITYVNNCPDSLRGLVINVDHDIFKAGTNRVYEVEAVDLTDGVQISNVKINGINTETAPSPLATRRHPHLPEITVSPASERTAQP